MGGGANVGVTTCTLWRRGREVDPREWMPGGGGGGEMEWRRGETYTLGEGGGSGEGEKIGMLQGFRDGRGRGRGSVGVVAHVGV